MNYYDIDTLVQVASAFSQGGAGAIDPTTVTLFVRDPNGLETTVPMASLTHAGTGVFTYQVSPSISGTWTYKFQGAGNVQVTTPDVQFYVRPSRLIAG
jgi:hypothetical protein